MHDEVRVRVLRPPRTPAGTAAARASTPSRARVAVGGRCGTPVDVLHARGTGRPSAVDAAVEQARDVRVRRAAPGSAARAEAARDLVARPGRARSSLSATCCSNCAVGALGQVDRAHAAAAELAHEAVARRRAAPRAGAAAPPEVEPVAGDSVAPSRRRRGALDQGRSSASPAQARSRKRSRGAESRAWSRIAQVGEGGRTVSMCLGRVEREPHSRSSSWSQRAPIQSRCAVRTEMRGRRRSPPRRDERRSDTDHAARARANATSRARARRG